MKIILTALLCMMMCLPVFADQQTTVLFEENSIGKKYSFIPVIDGSNETVLEKQANDIIKNKARELVKQLDGRITYEVTMNRPSLVSILLKSEDNGKTAYKGVNIDLTTGREFTMGDFFTETEELSSILGSYEDFVFGEEGIYLRRKNQNEYADFVPYSKIITNIRIGSAGRLLQVARLTQNAADKTLIIKAGNLLAIKLDSNPSTGYRWMVSTHDGVTKVGSSFIMPREDDRTGVSGTEIIMFAAQKAGFYNVIMEYKRPWENYAVNKFSFGIAVFGK